MAQAENAIGPLRGDSLGSKALDLFVVAHVVCAVVFAACMCFVPDLFKVFLVEPDTFTPAAADSVRWACGFVFGFAMFAAVSLWMPTDARVTIARVFGVSFTIATVCGAYTQTTGRWNEYHPINIAIFGMLALVYGIFSIAFQGAFARVSKAEYCSDHGSFR